MRTLPTLLLGLTLCLNLTVIAQQKPDVKFGKVASADFDVRSKLIDSGTSAVVVADIGSSKFIANRSDFSFSLMHTQKKRIKIINKNGFDAATVNIYLYLGSNGKEEKLEDFEAATYNLENGKVVETKLPKASLFTEKSSKNWITKKFTFPAIKEGSIIEYAYTIRSDFFFNLQPWTFQGPYPVLWSQYDAAIPDFFKFVTISQGYVPFFQNTVKTSPSNFEFNEKTEREFDGMSMTKSSGNITHKVGGNVDAHTWVMKDIPALKEEAYTSTVNNSVAKIEFQLKQVAFAGQTPRNMMNSWEQTAKELLDEETFGLPINRPNNWLDGDVKTLVANSTTDLQKAQTILNYVRDNFTHNGSYGIYTSRILKDVFKNKSGSVADINMLLIAMLKCEKLNATPIILSTRSHGATHPFYPILNRYNYVIAKLVHEGKTYFLDATAKHLPFGQLPLRVYNGHAREITNNNAFALDFAADSLRESGSTFVYIYNDEKTGLQGTFQQKMGSFQSLDLRNTMSELSLTDYAKQVKQQYPDEVAVSGVQLDSLKSLKDPVTVRYNLAFGAFTNEDIVYFSPIFTGGLKKNPFAAAQRFYPVEMPYTFDEHYSLVMEIPKGYKVEELPKSIKYKFNENEGLFEYIVTADKDNIQFRRRLMMNKATFANEDYEFLREFYAFIAKKDAEQIVFKKLP